MIKIIKASKDAYVSSRVVKGSRVNSSNVGMAGSLDLFKLYGNTSTGATPNIELSRLLLQFDLSQVSALTSSIGIGTDSFKCNLKLSDVYGGQTVPTNFSVVVNPLSKSFDEGAGKDVVFYADRDVCNFLTASRSGGTWIMSGCGLGGGSAESVDFITASSLNGANFTSTQYFTDGTEDLDVDVTNAVSATLGGEISNAGFRIALDPAHESDNKTYFVKRFASRTAYNEHKRPRLIVKFDDSIQDDTLSLVLDNSGTIFLRNYVNRNLRNLVSASSQVTGSSCVKLRLVTPVSGGFYELQFSGSQHHYGQNYITGLYSASVFVPTSDSVVALKLQQTGSVSFIPIWSSLDGTVGYSTGSTVTFKKNDTSNSVIDSSTLTVRVLGTQQLSYDQQTTLRVHIADASDAVFATRIPVSKPGKVIRDVHYRVRDHINNVTVIPFDTVHNSTRVSSDQNGMYFTLDPSNLTHGQSYVVDILVKDGDSMVTYNEASPPFELMAV